MSAEIVTLLPRLPNATDRCPNRVDGFSILCRAMVDLDSGSISQARAGIERALCFVREAERLNEPPRPPMFPR